MEKKKKIIYKPYFDLTQIGFKSKRTILLSIDMDAINAEVEHFQNQKYSDTYYEGMRQVLEYCFSKSHLVVLEHSNLCISYICYRKAFLDTPLPLTEIGREEEEEEEE